MSADHPTALSRLQSWYQAQCNEEWEHGYGIRIDTIDNPGWMLKIDLVETELAEKNFMPVEKTIDDPIDWFRCWKSESQFEAACGPANLEEVIEIFLSWASQSLNN